MTRHPGRGLAVSVLCAIVSTFVLAGGSAYGAPRSLGEGEEQCATVEGDLVCTGTVTLGTHLPGLVGGVSEWPSQVDGCNPDGSAYDGLDGAWFTLPDDAPRHSARLTFESAGDDDLAVWFYRDNCTFFAGGSMSEAPRNEPEIGFVPSGARYAGVVAIEGLEVQFEFTIATSEDELFPEPGQPVELVSQVFEVNAEDGTALRGHIYRPKGDGPFPVILNMKPYWNTSYGPSENQDAPGTVFDSRFRYLANAGYAVALVNLRGTGDSDGSCWHWGAATDIADVGTVIEALADPERFPWTSGNVGMYGASYGGWSGMMGIASGAAPLKTVIAMSPVIDLWSLYSLRGVLRDIPQFAHIGKALQERGVVFWGSDPLMSYRPDCVAEDVHDELAGEPTDTNHHPPVWNGDRNAFYRSVDLRPKIEGKDIPALVTSGLIPPVGYKGEPHILQFEGLWDLLGGNARFMLGQWGHDEPTAHRGDFRSMALAWFDHYLRGGPMLVEPGIAEYQDDLGGWRSSSQWPPASADEGWFLSGDALIQPSEDVATSERTFTGLGLPCLRVCLDAYNDPLGRATSLPFSDRGTPVCAPNHVAYVSEPLEEDLELAGNFTLDLTIESTLEDGNVFAYLIESDSADCSADGARIVARAMADLRHIRTEEGEQFPTGETVDVRLRSLPFAGTVHAGKRLVLAIGGDGQENAFNPDHWLPRVTIHTGDPQSGALWLPVVVEPPITVEIDIKPGTDDNQINTKSAGSIPVAVLSTESFDAPSSVDLRSVGFGPAGAGVVRSGVEDVDGDGHPDLVLHFNQQQTGLSSEDLACLTGVTRDDQNIRGCDAVNVK